MTITLDPGGGVNTYTITATGLTLALADTGNDLTMALTSSGNLNFTLTQDTGFFSTSGAIQVNSGNFSVTTNSTQTYSNTVGANDITLIAIGQNSDVTTNAALTTVSGGSVTITADDTANFSANGDITATGAGNITITANNNVSNGDSSDFLTMSDGTLFNAGSGTITLSNTSANNITIGGLLTTNSSNAAVTITTSAGVADAGTAHTDIVAASGRLVIDAVTGITLSNITVNSIDVDNTTSGNITLTESDAVSIIKLNNGSNGSSSFTATAGTITIDASGSGVTSVNGDITLVATGASSNVLVNATVSSDTSSGQVQLQADNNVTFASGITVTSGTGDLLLLADSDDDGTGLLTTPSGGITMNTGALKLTSGTGIGSSGSVVMTTGVTDFSANTTTGGIFLTNTGGSAINVTTVAALVGVTADAGDIQITNTGGNFSTVQTITASGGTADIKITAASMTIGSGSFGDIDSNGSINLTATGTITVTTGRQVVAENDGSGSLDFNINAAGVTLGSNGSILGAAFRNRGTGALNVTSTGNISLEVNSVNAAGALTINAGSNDITGNNASTNPEIFASGNVSITAANIGAGTGTSAINISGPLTSNGAQTFNLTVNGGGNAYILTNSTDDPFNQINLSVASASSIVDLDLKGSDFVKWNPSSGHELTATLNNEDIALNFSLTDSGTDLKVGNIMAGDGTANSGKQEVEISSNAKLEQSGTITMATGGSLRLVGIQGIGTSANPILTSGLTNFAATSTNGGIFLLNNSVTDINSTTVSSTVGVVALGNIIIKNTNGGFTFTDIIKSDNGSITLESKFNMLDLNGTADSLSAENGTVSLTVTDSGAFIGASGNPIEIRARGLTTSISNPANRFIAFTNTTPAATEDTPPPQQQQQQQQQPAVCTAALAAEGICTLTAQQQAPPTGGEVFTPENLPPGFGQNPSQELVDRINRDNTAGRQAGFVEAIGEIVNGPGC